MGVRREGRVAALQILYQLDTIEGCGLQFQLPQVIERYFAHLAAEAAPEVRRFAAALSEGVVEHREALDVLIDKASRNWRVARMSRVDRNVLRVAAFELRFLPEVPAGVAINEAIEIGRRFGSSESRAFINGVLDRLRRDLCG